MTWVCPYCGTENYQDDRIGFRGPYCSRCNQERETPEQAMLKKNTAINELRKEEKDLISKIGGINDQISSLLDEVAGLNIRMNDLKRERMEVMADIAEQESIEIFTEPIRHITPDQRVLPGLRVQ